MEDLSLPPAVCIMGATGTGKTELGIQLLDEFPFEIINVDSAQVFKEMNIGTAKPDAETLKRAPHRILDFIDPADAYSAADFRNDALREMREITAAGKIPLLVGGTMLYFRALINGIADLPPANPRFREKLQVEADTKGWGVLHERLQEIDPESAARIHPNDPQRLQRALEVYELTGTPLTTHHKTSKHETIPYRLLKFALIPRDREKLRERLACRFEKMLDEGLVEEVQKLYNRPDLSINLPSIRCVGYRQVWEHLNGEIDYNTMKERAIVATRQLAKRQMTWLRSEQRIATLHMEDENLVAVTSRIRGFLIQ
ncbi:MAG: tRNA dimethylallyltransferase (EC [uncultured Thiotrichaceae bacterium]|uniref:tRNA dimethylallyltransferase n=1 Tax=uncultured Thiotrichaceae bacterium TaxID=298394 RepID=A0A6S6T8Q2_9GAMM|nr:MAG: tRNA dimethylallyltransferase (EC [uncultured Thiotrichaceae bacterium]